MKNLLLGGAMAVSALFGGQSASRADVFDFSYTSEFGHHQTIIGTFTTGAADPSGSFYTPSLEVTGITGTFNGHAITGLMAVGTYFGNDNILYYPSSVTYLGQPSYLDIDGISFRTASDYVNLYFGLGGTGDVYGMRIDGNANLTLGILTVAPASTPTPEPASLAILAIGIGLVGFTLHRRRLA